jgi:hypothetical protein
MNIPGFAAEASLYNGNVSYQATAEASFYGGIVQPAQSDVFYPGRPVPFLSSHLFYPGRPIYCLKRLVWFDHNGTPHPYYSPGIWNPLTARCE